MVVKYSSNPTSCDIQTLVLCSINTHTQHSQRGYSPTRVLLLLILSEWNTLLVIVFIQSGIASFSFAIIVYFNYLLNAFINITCPRPCYTQNRLKSAQVYRMQLMQLHQYKTFFSYSPVVLVLLSQQDLRDRVFPECLYRPVSITQFQSTTFNTSQ